MPRPSPRAGGFDRPSRAHTPREGVRRAEDEDGRRAPRRHRPRRRRCVPAPFVHPSSTLERDGEKGTTRPRRRERSPPRRDPPVLDFADARSPPVPHAGEGEEAPAEPEVRRDPIFGFESRGEPDKVQPGFDTAEGGKVGPVGTFFISLLLIVLFGASFFFTSVPRDAIKGMVDLSDDPNAPTDVFK